MTGEAMIFSFLGIWETIMISSLPHLMGEVSRHTGRRGKAAQAIFEEIMI